MTLNSVMTANSHYLGSSGYNAFQLGPTTFSSNLSRTRRARGCPCYNGRSSSVREWCFVDSQRWRDEGIVDRLVCHWANATSCDHGSEFFDLFSIFLA